MSEVDVLKLILRLLFLNSVLLLLLLRLWSDSYLFSLLSYHEPLDSRYFFLAANNEVCLLVVTIDFHIQHRYLSIAA